MVASYYQYWLVCYSAADHFVGWSETHKDRLSTLIETNIGITMGCARRAKYRCVIVYPSFSCHEVKRQDWADRDFQAVGQCVGKRNARTDGTESTGSDVDYYCLEILESTVRDSESVLYMCGEVLVLCGRIMDHSCGNVSLAFNDDDFEGFGCRVKD
jgi:hypothetical protein